MSKQLNAFMMIAMVGLGLVVVIQLVMAVESLGDVINSDDDLSATLSMMLAWGSFVTAIGAFAFLVLIAIVGQVLENVTGARNDAAIQALRQANETPHTGRYRVIGIDGDSGMSTSVVVDASNPSDAKRVAKGQGLTGIESVQPA